MVPAARTAGISISGLPPPRRTAWSGFRPSSAPRLAQEETYGAAPCRSRGRDNEIVRYLHTSLPSSDPHGVFAAVVRTPVEPPVARVHREACFGEQRLPALRLEPPQRHRRFAARAADGERQRLLAAIPLRPFEDARLALEPETMRRLDVLARRREDVEDEPPAGEEQVAGGPERLDSLGVRPEMEVRAEWAGDERHALL